MADISPIPSTRPSPWFTYIVRCSDNSLYTGITTDLSRRIAEHNSTTQGAKYTRARQPVELVYYESATSRSDASKKEYRIKQLSVAAKNKLISGNSLLQQFLPNLL